MYSIYCTGLLKKYNWDNWDDREEIAICVRIKGKGYLFSGNSKFCLLKWALWTASIPRITQNSYRELYLWCT